MTAAAMRQLFGARVGLILPLVLSAWADAPGPGIFQSNPCEMSA